MFNKSEKKLYFVDTNVILTYESKKRGVEESPALVNFIESPNHAFFYSSTVKDELLCGIEKDKAQRNGVLFANRNKYFKYIPMSGYVGDYLARVMDLISRQFNESGLMLTDKQKNIFQNDINIIIESGYVCYDVSVMPVDVLTMPIFLTQNMKVLKKFINNPKAKDILDDVISAVGLERLMTVNRLDHEVERFVNTPVMV